MGWVLPCYEVKPTKKRRCNYLLVVVGQRRRLAVPRLVPGPAVLVPVDMLDPAAAVHMPAVGHNQGMPAVHSHIVDIGNLRKQLDSTQVRSFIPPPPIPPPPP